ncbi:unnamed protein product [Chrysodeixis includens]|uniref:Aspartate aminotransferase n=1 Tax=Chrysodeixis includens TaxID=689277 RepID=A0A9P0BZ64_CHRIL|nr:unnamed protein product [Chrysodeixis includens]
MSLGFVKFGATTAAQLMSRSQMDVMNHAVRTQSMWWGSVPMGAPDTILGIRDKYNKDSSPKKVNLGVGAYRDDDGKPFVLPSVRKAEELIYQKCMNHEYAPIAGEVAFREACAKLAFGDCSQPIVDKTNATVQTLSGTGALRLGLDFINRYWQKKREVWLPNPTWFNHPQICDMLCLPYKKYRYYDPKTKGFDVNGACEDLCRAPEGSVILLHACAHNPTGVDPKKEEWECLSKIIKEKKLFPFFDMAYQGFATGSVDRDAQAVRIFVKDGHQVMLAQSFAKNMGLYGERVGALTVLCGDKCTADKVMSQLKVSIRTIYSNPAINGSRIVKEILTNAELKQQWLVDVKAMADRIITMRKMLREAIEGAGSKHKWNHITDQIGMFCYTGLTPAQVDRITKECHIYLTKDGRISVAGITTKNVAYVAESIHKVTSS